MIRSVWRIVRNEDVARDVMQEALVKVHKNFRKIRKHPNPSALILRICHQEAISYWRKEKRRVEESLDNLNGHSFPDRDPIPDKSLIAAEQRMRIIAALGRLAPREAEAMTLLALEELTYPEIAAAMQCSQSTVRVLVSRARQRLRELLKTEKPSSLLVR